MTDHLPIDHPSVQWLIRHSALASERAHTLNQRGGDDLNYHAWIRANAQAEAYLSAAESATGHYADVEHAVEVQRASIRFELVDGEPARYQAERIEVGDRAWNWLDNVDSPVILTYLGVPQ